MKALRILKYAGFGILGLAFIFGTIWVVMLLWNSLVPGLFHGPELTYWQTAGLFILSKILLTGLAPGGHRHGPGREWRRKYYGKYCPPRDLNKENISAPEGI
ncbi:MAG: hypothetical protein WCE64_10395 [Bacteroidales bacterium]